MGKAANRRMLLAVSDEEILRLLRELPLLERTAEGLAKRLGRHPSTVRYRLRMLEARGKVRRVWEHSPAIWEAVERESDGGSQLFSADERSNGEH